MYTEFGSSLPSTSVCVCEPRQVWTCWTWTGASMLEMSKMRMPRKRVSAVAGGSSVQSFFARVSSTDMKSRFPYTDRSPWPPGHTTAAFMTGAEGFEMSQIWNPLKLPTNA